MITAKQSLVPLFGVSVLFLVSFASANVIRPTPSSITSEAYHKVVHKLVGDNATFECPHQANDFDKKIYWDLEPEQPLFAGTMKLAPNSRFHLVDTRNLHITNVAAEDHGKFRCYYGKGGENGPEEVVMAVYELLVEGSATTHDSESSSVSESTTNFTTQFAETTTEETTSSVISSYESGKDSTDDDDDDDGLERDGGKESEKKMREGEKREEEEKKEEKKMREEKQREEEEKESEISDSDEILTRDERRYLKTSSSTSSSPVTPETSSSSTESTTSETTEMQRTSEETTASTELTAEPTEELTSSITRMPLFDLLSEDHSTADHEEAQKKRKASEARDMVEHTLYPEPEAPVQEENHIVTEEGSTVRSTSKLAAGIHRFDAAHVLEEMTTKVEEDMTSKHDFVEDTTSTVEEATTVLVVHYAPKFSDPSPYKTYSAVGGEVNLTCSANGEPEPQYDWGYKDDQGHFVELPLSEVKTREDFWTRSVMVKNMTDKSQFRDFICRAKNQLGTAERIFTVEEVEKPPSPKFRLHQIRGDKMEYEVTLQEPSGPLNITGYRALIKPNGLNGWENATVVDFTPSTNHILDLPYHGTEYEIRWAAKNELGFGDFAPVQIVRTLRPSAQNVRASSGTAGIILSKWTALSTLVLFCLTSLI